MSLILDALNRSDSDRSGADASPGLHSIHGPGSRAEAPAWRRWLWPALTLVFALVAGLAWWGGSEAPVPRPAALTAPEAMPEQQPESDARDEASAASRQAALPGEIPSANRVAPATQRPAPGFSDDVAALYTQMQAAGVDPNEPVAPPTPGEDQPAAVSPAPSQAQPGAMTQLQQMAQMAELSKAARATTPTRSSVTDERSQPAARGTSSASAAASRGAAEELEDAGPDYDVDALATAAQVEMESRQRGPEPLVQHEAPFITDLRQSQKDEIPSIFYSQHNWSSNPSERSVVLNGQERREGQQVKPGLRLEEILEQSIVLNFNGTEFQLRSLNSWVNL